MGDISIKGHSPILRQGFAKGGRAGFKDGGSPHTKDRKRSPKRKPLPKRRRPRRNDTLLFLAVSTVLQCQCLGFPRHPPYARA